MSEIENREFRSIYEYCFTSLSAQSWQYRDRRKPEAGTVPYSYFESLQGVFIVNFDLLLKIYYSNKDNFCSGLHIFQGGTYHFFTGQDQFCSC